MTKADSAREPIDAEPHEPESPDLEGTDPSVEPDGMTLEEIVEAEQSRPDIPGETIDGLDEMDEEVRRQAEDLPADTPGRL